MTSWWKEKKKITQIDDLAETFANVRGTQLKFNSEKCVFGMQKGRALACLVYVKRIEANTDKNKYHNTHEASAYGKRSSETHMQNCIVESIHI
jgi:hypothetical protein